MLNIVSLFRRRSDPRLPRLWRIEHLPAPRSRPVGGMRIALLVLGALVAVVFLVRAGIDSYARRKTVELLRRLPSVEASFEQLHVTVLPPRWAVRRLKLARVAGGRPLLYAERVEISLVWRELLHRRTVVDLHIDEPQLALVPTSTTTPATPSLVDVRPALMALPPLVARRLEIRGGQVLVVDGTATAEPRLWLHGIDLVATGISTRPQLQDESPPATVRATGRLQTTGALSLGASLQPWARPAEIQQVRAELHGLELGDLVEALSPASAAVARGTIAITLDGSAQEGEVRGRLRASASGARIPGAAVTALEQELGAWVEDRGLNLELAPPAARGGFVSVRARIGNASVGAWPVLQALLRQAFVRGVTWALESARR